MCMSCHAHLMCPCIRYRHICWVASEYDMYGASAFGWIRDALYIRDMDTAERAISLSAVVIRAMADFLDLNNAN